MSDLREMVDAAGSARLVEVMTEVVEWFTDPNGFDCSACHHPIKACSCPIGDLRKLLTR